MAAITKWGVLGSGEVARVLAKGLRSHGWQARIGSRAPEKLAAYSAGTGIEAGTFAEVAAWGEGLVLAVLGRAAEEALRLAGPQNLRGKVVMDATNPIREAPPVDGVISLFTGQDESLMERLQRSYPEARFVKAFNSVGSDLMVNPVLRGGPPSMFYCGNDDAAKREVAAVIRKFGWETADMGTAAGARALEPLCVLWCIPGFRENDWSHAFRLLRP